MSDRTSGAAPDERDPGAQAAPTAGAPAAPNPGAPAAPNPGAPAAPTAHQPSTSAPPPTAGQPPVDLGRRNFFRSFSREAIQAAAQLVGAAAALQRSSLAATNQLLGTGPATPGEPFGQLFGLQDPTPTPPVVPFRNPYRYRDGELILIDQRRLPDELVEVTCHTGAEVAACIRDRLVRGGPVLGQVAAYGVLVAAERTRTSSQFVRAATLHGTINALRSSRPSSRAIETALDRLLAAWQAVGEHAAGDLVANVLRAAAEAVAEEAMLDHAAIGRAGAAVLPTPFERHLELLVHGPVGALAGGALGTALAVIQEVQVSGRPVHVWVPEGRPAFQGARLTAFELARLDIRHTVIADTAAAGIIARGSVDAVLVGAERIARNGDVSAAVGTYPLAAVAARHGVPVYVCAPLATVDPLVSDEWGFMAEERPADELAEVNGRRVPPAESQLFNPVLDVTPGTLVRGFVTELGMIGPPFETTLADALERRRSGPVPPRVPETALDDALDPPSASPAASGVSLSDPAADAPPSAAAPASAAASAADALPSAAAPASAAASAAGDPAPASPW